MNGQRLVDDYLDRLEQAARPLTTNRRRELVDDVREHIAEDLARSAERDEVAVRNVLDRLGPPDAIVGAELAAGGGGVAAQVSGLRPLAWNLGITEILAVLLLTVGAFAAPLIGPAIGLVLTWASARWSTRTRTAITLVAVVLLILPIVLLMSVSASAGPTP
jgi:hypothetical protein